MIKSFKHPFEPQPVWNDGAPLEDWLGDESVPPIAKRHLCFGGGKSGTSTQSQSGSVSGAPQATAMADVAWNRASAASNAPFQTYGGEFVAPVNQQQSTAIGNINNAADIYNPYSQQALSSLYPAAQQIWGGLSSGQQGTAGGMYGTFANSQLDPNSISKWMSPYIQNVVQATENQQQQQNAIQQSQLEGSAINSGAFGGDRSGVAAANLAYQQNLSNSPVIANLYNTGFTQALGTAQQQQQTGLSAANQFANIGNMGYTQGLGGAQAFQGLGNTYAGLGTTAQTNALGAAGAQLGAGTLQQQTQQAQDQALYNQFLQQQAYPFQTSQFLTNTASSLAPIYGTTSSSTGTATQPMSFFRRGGRVDITDMEMGDDGQFRPRKAGGGGLSDDIGSILAAHAAMYAPMGASAIGAQGPYGVGLSGGSGGHAQMPTVNLPSMSHQASSNTGVGHSIDALNRTADFGKNLAGLYSAGKEAAVGKKESKGNPATGGWWGYGGTWGASAPGSAPPSPTSQGSAQSVVYTNSNGQLVDASGNPVTNYASGGRVGFANGGLPYTSEISKSYLPDSVDEPSATQTLRSVFGSMGGGSSGGGGGGSGGLSSGIGHGLVDIFGGAGLGNMMGMGSGSMTDTFLKRGGRIGKDNGGGLSDDPMGAILISHGQMYDQGRDSQKSSDTGDGGMKPTQMPAVDLPGMSAQGPTSSGAGNAMQSIAKMAPMVLSFLAKGGRIHKEGGGGLTPVSNLIDPDKVAAIETGGGTDQNPKFPQDKGGPAGPHQFIRKTWGQFAQENPQFFEGKTPAEVDAARKDPAVSKAATMWYAGKNKKDLESAGLPVTPENLYLAHGQGAGGATALLKNPDKNVLEVLTPVYGSPDVAKKAVLDNGGKLDMTAGQFAQTFQNRYTGAKPQQVAAADPVNGPALSASPQSAPPQENWWNRESGGLSGTERAVISLLSGLGGMASSPSRFLGSAILSGLGAGAGTYGQLAQKGKALDISQQQANTAVGRLGIEGVKQSTELYNKLLVMAQAAARNGQQPPEWLTSQLRSLSQALYGYMPGPGQGLSAGQGAPSGGPGLGVSPPALPTQGVPPPTPVKVAPLPAPAGSPTPPPQGGAPPTPPATANAPPHTPGTPPAAPPQIAAVMPKMDFSQLPNEKNPDWLMERSREQGALGNGEAADKFRNEAQALYDRYGNEGHAMVNGQVVAIPGWDQMQAWKQRIPENQKYMNEQADQSIARNRARQQLNTIAKVMEFYQTGALSDFKAEAQALAKSLGIDVPNTAGMNAAAYQEFMKSAIRNAFADVKDMGGKPLVTEIDNSMRATANPGLQPEANRKIIAMLYGQLDQADKFGKEFGAATSANPGIQRQQFAADWLNKKENDLTAIADERERGLATRGATPDLKDVQLDHTYIIEPGQEAKYGLPLDMLKGRGPTKMKRVQGPDGQLGWKPVQ